MADTETITLNINAELKEQAAALFQSLGMDLSTATGIFYRQALRYQGLPFEVRLDNPNEITRAAMEAAEKDEDMYGPFDSAAACMEAAIPKNWKRSSLFCAMKSLCQNHDGTMAFRI